METQKQYRVRLIKQNEDDMVSAIYHFRDKMRNVQRVIHHDLVKMTGEYACFVSHAADELEQLVRRQREIELALSIHDFREPGYTQRVIQRVIQREALKEREANSEEE